MNYLIARSLQNIEDVTDGAPEPQAASERAPSEPAGPAKVVAAVATGSLPVSSVLYLIERWSKNAGQWKSDVEYHERPIFKDDQSAAICVASCEARASIYAVCIQDLRAEMARAIQSQPEENVEMRHDRR